MSRNNIIYSVVFISGLASGFIIKSYLPEDFNTFNKIGQKLTTIYETKTTKLTRDEIAKRAEQRLKNGESKSSSL